MANPNIQEMFKDLALQMESHSYDAGSKVAVKILKALPDDFEALACQIACLIHMNKFEEALSAIDNSGFSELLEFQKVYCLYRLFRGEEALQLISKASKDTDKRRLMELEAQIYYRSEDYKKAIEVYEKLQKSADNDYETEKQTNLCASYAGVCGAGFAAKSPTNFSSRTFELYYNLGCLALSENQYKKALTYLNQAKKTCKETLGVEEYTEAEIEEEIAIIDLQIGVVNHHMNSGNPSEVYNRILQADSSDLAHITIAEYNLKFLEKQLLPDLDLNQDQMKKMTSLQQSIIQSNYANQLFSQEEFAKCQEQCATLMESNPKWEVPVLIQVATLIKLNDIKAAIALLQGFLKKQQNISCELALAQLQLNNSDPKASIKTLQSICNYKQKAGIVSAVISLYKHMGLKSEVLNLLIEIKTEMNKDILDSFQEQIFLALGFAYMAEGKYEESAKVYEEALSIDNSSHEILAALVLAYCEFDPEKAEVYAEQLPDKPINPKVIEDLLSESTTSRTAKPKKNNGKPRRKKKGPLPKDLNKQLDEERWLPLWQRSTNRRKKKNPGKGNQGAATSTAGTGQTGSARGVKGKNNKK